MHFGCGGYTLTRTMASWTEVALTIVFSVVIVAVCAALVLRGCGSSPPPSASSYTITPKGGLNSEIFVTFSGPVAATRNVMRAFEAAHKIHYMLASPAIGQTNCNIAAAGGKVTVSVVSAVGSNPSLWQTLCTSISGRF